MCCATSNVASDLALAPGSGLGTIDVVSFPLAPLLIAIATLSGQSSALVDLERAAAASPSDVQAQRRLAAAYETAGRRLDAVTAWIKVTGLAPQAPGGWYALGLAYSAISQEAVRSRSRTAPRKQPGAGC